MSALDARVAYAVMEFSYLHWNGSLHNFSLGRLMQFLNLSSVLLGLVTVTTPVVAEDGVRTWNSIDQSQQFEARAVAFDGELVLFETTDGEFLWAASRFFSADGQSQLASMRSVSNATGVVLNDLDKDLPIVAVRIGGTNSYDVIKSEDRYHRVEVGTYGAGKRTEKQYIATGLKAKQRRAAKRADECSTPVISQAQCLSSSPVATSQQCFPVPVNSTQCNPCGGNLPYNSYPVTSQTHDVIPESPLAHRPPMKITIPYTVQRYVDGVPVQETRSITRNMTQQETINYLLDKLDSKPAYGSGNLGAELRKLDEQVFGTERNRSTPLEQRVDELESKAGTN